MATKKETKNICNDVNLMYNNDQRLAPFTLVNLPYIIKNQQSVITGTKLKKSYQIFLVTSAIMDISMASDNLSRGLFF
jgi:hypothetical protein